ncbi:hypothetical protein H1D33_03385 [Micromonospora robiginosa]|uniref:Uncharacterized protein n=1 Tax=Micromonospora robiginosa TaxID=2749844 RepID=A0A7L6B811_9ACTN|nr:hypothetical protein [Micromonospora ferruginea]QLQ37949.2 hypothetical protein H1D33_03385 [Micromonospora ferruginea]
MSETGQPGAATPGEHGDGTGQQDDPARTGGGWAPPANGWSRGAPAPGGWPYGDLGGGWAASSPRHGDLPAPLPGHPADEPPAHVNGRHVNGVRHAGEESPVTRQAPVSAPPVGEPPRETDGDRLAVPAPRPAPAIEQQPADAGGSRHASDDTSAGRIPRWAESGPTSAPPALQVPPVGAAASGFEVPPGFHAPTVDPAAPAPHRGWADREPAGRAEPSPTEPPAHHQADLRPPDGSRATGDPMAAAGPRAAADPGPRAVADPMAAADPRGTGPDDPGTGPTGEPDWSGPSWNRPSWGDGWAPPWARTDEPAGRRAVHDEGPGTRRAREDEPADRAHREDEPTGRRAARADRAAEWAPEPVRPYEPARVEPPTGYEPPRPEPVRPYEPLRAESTAGHEPPHPEPTRPFRLPREDGEPRPGHEPATQRPSWAGPPVPVTPFGARPEPTGAPVSPREAPAGPPPAAYAPAPAARAVGEPADESHRPPDQPPAEPAGVPPVSAAPAPPAPAAFDPYRSPRPTSAPPYAARRSAPEPPPAAEPVAESPPAPVLPQRVPAEPDVPVVPEPPAVEPSAETPELARIATHLRRDDEPAPLRERPEGFDVNAILDAVREVAGVRDAALRRTPAGAHSLRLDLADGADPADVSRLVARLLQERMGLAAAPQNLPGAPAVPPPPVRRRSAAARGDRLAELPAEPRSGTPQPRADEPPAATGAPGRTRPPGPAGYARRTGRPRTAPARAGSVGRSRAPAGRPRRRPRSSSRVVSRRAGAGSPATGVGPRWTRRRWPPRRSACPPAARSRSAPRTPVGR